MLTFLMILHANYIHSYSVTTFTAGIRRAFSFYREFLTSIEPDTIYVKDSANLTLRLYYGIFHHFHPDAKDAFRKIKTE